VELEAASFLGCGASWSASDQLAPELERSESPVLEASEKLTFKI